MKSILLHVYDDTGLEGRMQAAFDLARAFEGHITCVHPTPFEDYLATDPWIAARLPEEFSDKMRALRLAFQERVEARLRAEAVNWDWVHVDEQAAVALARFATVADVAVVSLAGRAFERHEPRPVAAAVATGAPAPVLAVPEDFGALRLDAPAILAWNGSPEAAAAMKAAVPLLARMKPVRIVEVEERVAPYPGDVAAHYLARHGIEVEIDARAAKKDEVANAIVEAARDCGAGLIVMGAYGRSRLRELLLGGVTRDLLGSSEFPLLLAH